MIYVTKSGLSTATSCRPSCVSNAHTITPTTVTTPSTRTRSEPSKRRPPPELAKHSAPIQTVILLFDQDGHPVVPTCASHVPTRTAAVKDGRRPPHSGAQRP